MKDEDKLGEDQGDGNTGGGKCHIVVDGVEVDLAEYT